MDIKDLICNNFAENVGLTKEEIFEKDLTLSQIMLQSDILENSIDLMEVFAKTANVIKKYHNIEVRLPAFSLETKISKVLEIFILEVNKKNKQ